jgi:spermidine/putrescine transport system permease protein
LLPSIPQPRLFNWIYLGYVLLFFTYLAAPLVVVGVFAFNDSLFPALPWNGFTLDWFTGKRGIFNDGALLDSVGISLLVAFWVTFLSLLVATGNAFLFEREHFPLKNFLYILMLTPLVIPGVILGISILVFSNTLANGLEEFFNLEVETLRPGLMLIVLGQFAFITTIATLIISARLRRFDQSLEDAARNLGATRFSAIRTVTLPYLRPALLGAGIVSFLMSFENFNTTLMLVGSDAPLTITMFNRLREGSTPALNAVSLLLMLVSGALALISILVQRGK